MVAVDWDDPKVKWIAVVALIAVLFALPVSKLMLDVGEEAPGYEGVTVDIVAVRGDFTYNRAKYDYSPDDPRRDSMLYKIGDPAPPNASRWNIEPDRIVIDPDDEFRGVPDLVVKVGQARWMDVDPRDGSPLPLNKDPLEWDVKKPDGSTERVNAWIYRTNVTVLAWVHVGEAHPGTSEWPGTEKQNRVQDVKVYIRLGTHQWRKLYAQSQRFATILLVHPMSVTVGPCDVQAYSTERLVPKNTYVNFVASFDPQTGQKVAMYKTVEGQTINPYVSGMPSAEQVRDWVAREYYSPDPGNMPEEVYFTVYIGDLGPTPVGWGSEWETPYVAWNFRVDVLVLAKWKVPLPVDIPGPEAPYEYHPYGYWSRVFGWGYLPKLLKDLNQQAGNVAEQLGVEKKYVAWGVYFVIALCVGLLIFGMILAVYKRARRR